MAHHRLGGARPAGGGSTIRRLPAPPRPSASGATPWKLRVLIADDHALFTEALRAVLEQEDWIEVVGRAQNGQEAVDLAAALAPDLILIDLEMPIMDGIEATRRIREYSGAVLLVLTSSISPHAIEQARAAGASGFLRKDAIYTGLIAELADLGGGATGA